MPETRSARGLGLLHDPEFERQLEWMRTFVREEVWPIEAVEYRLTQAELDRINAALQAAMTAAMGISS